MENPETRIKGAFSMVWTLKLMAVFGAIGAAALVLQAGPRSENDIPTWILTAALMAVGVLIAGLAGAMILEMLAVIAKAVTFVPKFTNRLAGTFDVSKPVGGRAEDKGTAFGVNFEDAGR